MKEPSEWAAHFRSEVCNEDGEFQCVDVEDWIRQVQLDAMGASELKSQFVDRVTRQVAEILLERDKSEDS